MARKLIERQTVVLVLSLLLLASGTPQVLARDAAQDAFLTDARNNTTTNTCDALGNLIVTEDPLGGITEHTYDSRGRMTSAENPLNRTETWAYDPVTGTLTTWTDRRGNPKYHLTDALGSVRGVYDLSGAQAASTEYDVFGDVRASTGTPSLFAYTGEQHDPTTGFTHLRARDYDPATVSDLLTSGFNTSLSRAVP